MFRLHRATGPDIVSVASRLFLAPTGGRHAAKRLIETCALSTVWAASSIQGGTPAGLWGGAPEQDPLIASFWMLMLEPLDGSSEVVPLSRLAVEEMLDIYDQLENYLEASQRVSVCLMQAIGFTVDAPLLEETSGRLLHRVWLARPGMRTSELR